MLSLAQGADHNIDDVFPTQGNTLDVYKRMQYFNCALNSSKNAINKSISDSSLISSVVTNEYIVNIEEQLTVLSKPSLRIYVIIFYNF